MSQLISRILLTILLFPSAALVLIISFLLIEPVFRDETALLADDVARVIGCFSATVLWMIATIVVWRETPAERAARLSRAGADALVCPSCGYNLTGLHEARCPECGASFTLNELLAAQPGRASAEVEQV